MPPLDPRLIPQQGAPGLPMGSLPTGTRASDPYAGGRLEVSQGNLANTIKTDAERLEIARRQDARDALKEARDAKEFAMKVAKEQAKQKLRDPIDEMLGVIDAAATSHRLTRKGGTSGNAWGRTIGAYVPGTQARDLSGYVDTIGANTAFEKLQQLRQESPTGGAVGNVSDTDMKLLKSVIASLDPGQSNEKLQKSMESVLRTYQKVLYKLPGGREAYRAWRLKWLGYDPEKRKKANQPAEDVDAILKQYGVE